MVTSPSPIAQTTKDARFGLELSYDSILRGTNGIVHRRKVRNKFLDITDTPPIDGADIVTTIDVSMQDLAERSLIDELKEINAMKYVYDSDRNRFTIYMKVNDNWEEIHGMILD